MKKETEHYAIKVGVLVATLGQYAVFKCCNCNGPLGNWATGEYTFAECDCTLTKTGSRFRTIAKVKDSGEVKSFVAPLTQ